MYAMAHDTYEKIPAMLFREHPLLEKTLHLIRIAHGRQTYNGAPYFHHPIRVLLRMNWFNLSSEEAYAALFHDTKEDTELSDDDLKFFGYNNRVIDLRDKLTREKDGDQTYKEYIVKLITSGDVGAIRIKLSDLYENSNNVRFLPPEKRKVLVRYGKSLTDVREYLSKDPVGTKILENTISGELDKDTLEAWIRTEPTFL